MRTRALSLFTNSPSTKIMKINPSVFILVTLLISCKTNTSEPPRSLPKDSMELTDLKFLTKRVAFKDVPEDTLLTAKYTFVNTGPKALFITDVSPDCTCTGYTLSNKMVPPKDSGYILLKYSTKEKFGESKAYVTVTANTPIKLYSLEIVATVKDK